jgi:hypothetical protein
LDVFYGGLGTSELQFLIQNFFFHDPDPERIWTCIRISIQPKMLDPDPDQMNTDPKRKEGKVHFVIEKFEQISAGR